MQDNYLGRYQTFCRVLGTATASLPAGIPFLQPFIDNPGCASDSWVNAYCLWRTVASAGPAFHASIEVDYARLIFLHHEYLVRKDLSTSAAACAYILVEFESRDIFLVVKDLHQVLSLVYNNRSTSSSSKPTASDTPMMGKLTRISFFTSERDMKLVQPVKRQQAQTGLVCQRTENGGNFCYGSWWVKS